MSVAKLLLNSEHKTAVSCAPGSLPSESPSCPMLLQGFHEGRAGGGGGGGGKGTTQASRSSVTSRRPQTCMSLSHFWVPDGVRMIGETDTPGQHGRSHEQQTEGKSAQHKPPYGAS